MTTLSDIEAKVESVEKNVVGLLPMGINLAAAVGIYKGNPAELTAAVQDFGVKLAIVMQAAVNLVESGVEVKNAVKPPAKAVEAKVTDPEPAADVPAGDPADETQPDLTGNVVTGATVNVPQPDGSVQVQGLVNAGPASVGS